MQSPPMPAQTCNHGRSSCQPVFSRPGRLMPKVEMVVDQCLGYPGAGRGMAGRISPFIGHQDGDRRRSDCSERSGCRGRGSINRAHNCPSIAPRGRFSVSKPRPQPSHARATLPGEAFPDQLTRTPSFGKPDSGYGDHWMTAAEWSMPRSTGERAASGTGTSGTASRVQHALSAVGSLGRPRDAYADFGPGQIGGCKDAPRS